MKHTKSFLAAVFFLLPSLFKVLCVCSPSEGGGWGEAAAQNPRLWATYYGGTSTDMGYSIATDALNNVYLAGYTASTSGIASGGFQNTYGGGASDAFLVKFD